MNRYIVVANRKDWTLAYPHSLWAAMTPGEQQEMIARQQALFVAMENTKKHRTGAVRRSKAKNLKKPENLTKPHILSRWSK